MMFTQPTCAPSSCISCWYQINRCGNCTLNSPLKKQVIDSPYRPVMYQWGQMHWLPHITHVAAWSKPFHLSCFLGGASPTFPANELQLEERLAYSKFVSLFTFIALALPSSGRAKEENGKISQTLTTQNSSLVQIISTLYFESKRICFIPLFCWISQQFNIMGCRNLNIATEIPYVPTARLCDWLIDGRALLFLQLQPALARASLWHWWQMREWNSCMIE